MKKTRHNHHLVQRNGWWYINWRIAGQRIFSSTGIPVGATGEEAVAYVRQARAYRDRYMQDVLRTRGRDPHAIWNELTRALDELADEQQQRLRRAWAAELLAGVGRRLAIAEAFAAWERDPQRGSAGETTMAQYRAEFARFADWASRRGLSILAEVDEPAARAYAADLWGSGVAAGTFNAHLSFLRSCWEVLRVPAALPDNPWMRVKRREAAAEGREELGEAQVRALYERADEEWRGLILVGLYTGLRLVDAVTLRWEAVDLAAHEISLVPAKRARHGDRARIRVPLHPVLEAWLAAQRRESGDVFRARAEMYRRDRSAVTKEFRGLLEAAGITPSATGHAQRLRAVSRYGYHSLRHSFVSICRRAGVPDVVVAELVGHASTAMTRHYTHGDPAQAAAAMAALPAAIATE